MDDAIKSLIVFFGFPGYGKGFDRQTCATSVQAMLQSNDSAAISVSQNPLFFFTNASGLLANDSSNPQLTQYGCNQFCGSKMGLYPNTPIRLLTWFIPAILLVTNMQFEPLEKSELFAIMHLFGNPINFIWMSLVKVEEWSRCRYLAEKVLKHPRTNPDGEEINILDMATVLSAIRELAPESSDHFHFNGTNETIDCPCVQAGLRSLYKELATEIIDSKMHGTFRTIFSIILFIFGMISSFFPVLGGSKTPSSAILFPAIFISWMLPAILLNNIVGQFKSSRDCLRIISKLDEEILLRQRSHTEPCRLQIGDEPWMRYIQAKDWKVYFQSQSWRYSISSFLHRSSCPLINGEGIPNRLACFAFLPVVLSFALAFYIQYSYPTNFSCRHYIIIFAFFAWLLSPIINAVIIQIYPNHPRARFFYILLKDSVIGIAVIGLLVASTCGLFNNCWCWSGVNVKGHPVVLNPAVHFAANDDKIYPGTVGAVLFMQLCLFFVMCLQGRKGLRVMSRSNKEKRNALPEALTSGVELLERRQISG